MKLYRAAAHLKTALCILAFFALLFIGCLIFSCSPRPQPPTIIIRQVEVSDSVIVISREEWENYKARLGIVISVLYELADHKHKYLRPYLFAIQRQDSIFQAQQRR